MSSQGRGSEVVAVTVAVVCLLLVLNFEMTQASEASTKMAQATGGRTYMVEYWSLPFNGWPGHRNIQFRAGDVLLFNYVHGFHNVAVVNQPAYFYCDPRRYMANFPIYSTGHDLITLVSGPNYFICNVPRHCVEGGMKIEINAN